MRSVRATVLPCWTSRWIRLPALLALLALLMLCLLTDGTGALRTGAGPHGPAAGAWAVACPARGAPAVASVGPGYIRGLRDDVRSVILGRRHRLYELGTVASENAWSDDGPHAGATDRKSVV